MARLWKRTVGVVTCALALVVWSAAPAPAVVDGQPDGNAHPNVGLVVGFDANGVSTYFCTGTLVDPFTVLTAGHCASNQFNPTTAHIVVTFQTQLGTLPDGLFDASPFIVATPEPDPAWIPAITPKDLSGGLNAFYANSRVDISLLHLAHDATAMFGITPAPITAAGTNDVYATGQDKTPLLQVGYGVDRDGPPGRPDSYFFEGRRNQSSVIPKKVDTGLLYLGANPNDQAGYGSPCSGDSGSPVFRGTTITSLVTFADGNCQNSVGGPRLDSGPARDFLRAHGLVP